jgi:hypothetical protein
MKRFLLFYGPIKDAAGGWDDFAGDHDTIEEATASAIAAGALAEWWHVVDTQTGQYAASAPDGLEEAESPT